MITIIIIIITLYPRYEDLKKVRLKNMLGMSMLPLWAYLGK